MLKNGIVGLTHNDNDERIVKIPVAVKVGMGMTKESNGRTLPSKSDEFVISVHDPNNKGWAVSNEITRQLKEAMQKKYGLQSLPKLKKIDIIFLDNDIDNVIKMRMAYWTASRLHCSGDGREGLWKNEDGSTEERSCTDCPYRKESAKDGKTIPPLCKPEIVLYFTLVHAPRLGTVCKFTTTGFTSASNLYSSILSIQSKLPNKNIYGVPMTLTMWVEANRSKGGTKPVASIEIADQNFYDLVNRIAQDSKRFEEIAGKTQYLIEDESEKDIAKIMTTEFSELTEDERNKIEAMNESKKEGK